MGDELFAGADIGTSAVKVVLADASGAVVKTAIACLELDTPQVGWAEQDPGSWWRGLVEAFGSIPPELRDRISGLSLSGQMHGLVLLDANDEVIRPAILWCDQRTADESTILEREHPSFFRDVALNPPLSGFTVPKVLWMKIHEAAAYARGRSALLPKDYIRFRLTGVKAQEISDGAGTAMMDVARGVWGDLASLGFDPSWFPPIIGSTDESGRITAEVATELGIPQGIPVFGGGADNACGAVGNGVVSEGQVVVSVGSSGTVLSPVTGPLMDPDFRVHTFNHAVPDTWYLMGVMLSAGMSVKWVSEELLGKEYRVMDSIAELVPPGSEGLTFLPYLQGERTPHKDPLARGVFYGLSMKHTAGHVARSVLEGVAFGLLDSLEILLEMGVAPVDVYLTGGGASSKVWSQIIADILGYKLLILEGGEGPALGAALLAATGCGVFSSVQEAGKSVQKVKHTVIPRPEVNEAYAPARKRYVELYQALKGMYRSG